MARNAVFEDNIATSQEVPAGTLSGAPVLGNGVIPGVALTDRGAGGNISTEASVQNGGVWDFEVAEAVATKGLPIYLTAEGILSTVELENTLFGYAWETKQAGAGTIRVRIAKV